MPSVSKSSKAKSKSKPTVVKLKKSAKPALKITQRNGVKVAFAKGAKVFAKAVKAVKAAEKSAEKSVGKMIANAKAASAKSAAAKAGKRVYFFGGGRSEGSKEMKNLLGGKGANLAEMANIGLPVPPGFTITTEVCTEFYDNGKKLPKGLDADMRSMVTRMERLVGAKFGDQIGRASCR